jgi:hypothetical protein
MLFIIIIIIIINNNNNNIIIIIISEVRMPQLKAKEAITQARHMTMFRNLFSSRFVVLFTKEAIPR